MDIRGDSSPDYVLLGHVARDRFGASTRPGGSVLFAGATAGRFGRRVGIVTAGDVALDRQPGLETAVVAHSPSSTTTTFAISETEVGRTLRLTERAAPLTMHAVPPDWFSTGIVHLAPIADEMPPAAVESWPNAMRVATPQGWLRDFNPDGAAHSVPERALALPLERFDALVVSADDLDNNLEIARAISTRVRTLALTRGRNGCTVYRDGRETDVPAHGAPAQRTVGAGDVFAAAFFVRLSETDDAIESARFGSAAAGVFLDEQAVPNALRQAVADRLAGGAPCIA